jgi:formamidase
MPTLKADLAALRCNFGRIFAVEGGAQDCPYTFMQDMAAGRYQLPWEVQVTDGTSCGFAVPTRHYRGPEPHPLVPDAIAVAEATLPKKVA